MAYVRFGERCPGGRGWYLYWVAGTHGDAAKLSINCQGEITATDARRLLFEDDGWGELCVAVFDRESMAFLRSVFYRWLRDVDNEMELRSGGDRSMLTDILLVDGWSRGWSRTEPSSSLTRGDGGDADLEHRVCSLERQIREIAARLAHEQSLRIDYCNIFAPAVGTCSPDQTESGVDRPGAVDVPGETPGAGCTQRGEVE